jgi:outer membrane protein assembly factor BamB
MKNSIAAIVIPGVLAVVGIVVLIWWAGIELAVSLEHRLPGLDGAPPLGLGVPMETPVPGEPILGDGKPSELPGQWPWFRGPNLDAICDDGVSLARKWPPDGPKRVWPQPVKLGQGFASAAVREGRVYVLDYDEEALADTMRCLSLADGREIWRNSYPVEVSWNHGMSRTVPAIVGPCVISLGPKCHVTCWDAETGRANWLLDLVLDYGATLPQWYAGQCPLIDNDRLILAPGGDALLMAVNYESGEVIWQSPNPPEACRGRPVLENRRPGGGGHLLRSPLPPGGV